MFRKSFVLVGFVLLFASCAASVKTGDITESPEVVTETDEREGRSRVKMETYTTGAKPPAQKKIETGNNPEGVMINWMDFESAIDANKIDKKPILIYTYTDWCTWCKKMKATTFQDQEVITLINENYYPVMINPEKNQAIAYKEVLYEMKTYGKKSYNELVVNLMGGKMSFPTVIILSKREVKKETLNGYQPISQMKLILNKYTK